MSDYDCVGVTSDYLNSLKNKITELEQQNKYLTEQNKEVILQSRIEQLEAEKAELLEALRYFVNRVEEGSIRSKTTYAMYKSILKKHGVEI